MSQIIASIRTSTDKQDLNNQKLEILEWAHKKEVKVDAFVEITISSRKTSKQRRIEEVLQMLTGTDTLVVTELSRLGRSTASRWGNQRALFRKASLTQIWNASRISSS